LRVALISNPHSARNRKRLAELDERLAGRALHHVSHDLGRIDETVRDVAAADLDLLGINGGDGTVHRVLTALASQGLLRRCARIAVLPGGSTNMTAHDLNGGPLSLNHAFDAFLRAVDGHADTVTREAVAIRTDDRPTQLGFFFGMGAIIRGIEFCHQRIFALGIRKEWASGAALLRAAWGIARRERVFAEGVDLEAKFDERAIEGRASIFLVSTLARLFLGIKPFWGEGDGALASTWVAEDAERFLRTLPALLRGDQARLESRRGYTSTRAMHVAVRGGEQYTIDGEIYRTASSAVEIEPYRLPPIVALRVAA